MSIKQRYLKDENGEAFSPIVSSDSVLISDKTLTELVSFERDETVVGIYEQEGYLYAKNVVITTKPADTQGASFSVGSNIDIKFFVGKVYSTDLKTSYAIPFYESSDVFCRVEFRNDSIIVKTGSSGYGNGYVTGRVFYTKK